jgi:hypothetical protein
MEERNHWSLLREEWEVVWVSPSGSDEYEQGSEACTFIETRSNSLQLLVRANVPKQKMMKEVLWLLQAINEELLDDLEHDIPPGWIRG